MNHTVLKKLPKKLAICFTLWGLYDTPGKNATYSDMDKFVREHKERGFNCIRLDDGAGLVHDFNGQKRGTVHIETDVFGKHSAAMRDIGDIFGDGGKCDLYKRLIELCVAAKKYGMLLILSSWYYLHTFWFHPVGDALSAELNGIEPLDRFMQFARFLDFILTDLEKQGLDDCIAFCEIFNESDGLAFINGYDNKNRMSDARLSMYRKKHEEALNWLQQRHQQILFGFDSYTPWTDIRQVPSNMQVYNFHNYYLWSIYDEVLAENKFLIRPTFSEKDVRLSRTGKLPAADDWYERVALYNNLDIGKLSDFEWLLEQKLKEKFDFYLQKVDKCLLNVKEQIGSYDVPIVCGEGVSYIGSKQLLWEEKSELYWKLVEKVTEKYRDFGLWGTVVRTCCAPVDPCWNLCADKLRHINNVFMK